MEVEGKTGEIRPTEGKMKDNKERTVVKLRKYEHFQSEIKKT